MDERVIVVTGAANGIGRDYARALVQDGARVVIADLDGTGARALAAELDAVVGEHRAVGLRLDVTSPGQVAKLPAAVEAAFGRLDVLVNNAGSYPHVPFADIDFAQWRRVMAVNLDSVYLCSHAVAPMLVAQGHGSIVNVATNLVWSGLANMAHYIAAKSGVVGFTKALARELGPHGVSVNALAPGAVIPDERLTEAGHATVSEIVRYQALQRPQRSADLVGAMCFLCSPAADFVTGQVLTVDGGLTMH